MRSTGLLGVLLSATFLPSFWNRPRCAFQSEGFVADARKAKAEYASRLLDSMEIAWTFDSIDFLRFYAYPTRDDMCEFYCNDAKVMCWCLSLFVSKNSFTTTFFSYQLSQVILGTWTLYQGFKKKTTSNDMSGQTNTVPTSFRVKLKS